MARKRWIRLNQLRLEREVLTRPSRKFGLRKGILLPDASSALVLIGFYFLIFIHSDLSYISWITDGPELVLGVVYLFIDSRIEHSHEIICLFIYTTSRPCRAVKFQVSGHMMYCKESVSARTIFILIYNSLASFLWVVAYATNYNLFDATREDKQSLGVDCSLSRNARERLAVLLTAITTVLKRAEEAIETKRQYSNKLWLLFAVDG